MPTTKGGEQIAPLSDEMLSTVGLTPGSWLRIRRHQDGRWHISSCDGHVVLGTSPGCPGTGPTFEEAFTNV